ncbi:hypothetical protein C7B77_07685 [Chamaesiphon polymorphus CCALA 037]|uniref:Uncharacterized protein n=1 Tax=Chamaesiphon polymorphus CCALA 037 TaxID=2107692 RepID=A0A2T1GIS1_9CYAN|nr:hypothetical protein C7B77_07685 [Chamaesiphon polymorphus CCALA 037]
MDLAVPAASILGRTAIAKFSSDRPMVGDSLVREAYCVSESSKYTNANTHKFYANFYRYS